MSAAAESNGVANGGVIELVRAEYLAAAREGRDPRGRTTLVARAKAEIGPHVTEHQVRQAMDQARAETTSPPPAATSEPPALDQTPEADDLGTDRAHAAGGAPTHDATSLAPTPPALVTPAHQPATSRPPRPWPLVLIGLAAAVAVWSGWVGLGEMAGFGPINLLPGIGDGWTVNSAIVLPISVEAYAAYALRVWLSTSHHSVRTIRFARRSTITSLVVGGAAQVAYHLLSAAGYRQAPWVVTMLVALVPVLVLGVASALAKLVSADRQGGEPA
jgi:hypothetical protein